MSWCLEKLACSKLSKLQRQTDNIMTGLLLLLHWMNQVCGGHAQCAKGYRADAGPMAFAHWALEVQLTSPLHLLLVHALPPV